MSFISFLSEGSASFGILFFKFSKFKRKAQENSPGESRAGSACIGAARYFLSFTLIDARLYGKADRPGENFFCGA